MSTVLEPAAVQAAKSPQAAPPRGLSIKLVNLGSDAHIPGWVCDLPSFRKWADSSEYPDRGKFSYLQGELFVDLELEELFSHNLIKTELSIELGRLIRDAERGYFFSDGVRLSHPGADLSAEPDAVFTSYAAIQSGRVKLVRGTLGGYVELEGSPELVVEVVSRSSVRKDTIVLKDLYAQAGIGEYWIVDARRSPVQFQLWVLTPEGYAAAELRDGQPFSPLLQRPVAIGQSSDPLGNPRFTLTIGA
jgi:Uma2 family endonuclease